MNSAPELNGNHRPVGAAGRLVSIPALVSALCRRWRLWISGGLLGFVAALVFSMAAPPEHTARTILLLHHPSQSDKSRAMLTDARLVESRSVAQAAIQSLGLKMSPSQLVDQYQPAILSDDLLQIKVSAPTDREAVRRAEAVATSMLAFRRDELQRQATVALESLEERERQLNTELQTVNEEISARAGAAGVAELRVYSQLLARQASLRDKVGSVRQRIDLATLDTESIIANSRIIDPAGADGRAPVKAAMVNAIAGIILGLLLSTGWIVFQEVTSDRLRRRDDVAAALGAPIAGSIPAVRGSMWMKRRRFRSLLTDPTPEVASVVEHIGRVLEQAGPGRKSLVLVSVESDASTALAVASVTLQLIRDEKSVLVVDLTRQSILARLTKVRPDAPDRLPLVGSASAIWVSFPPHQRPRLEELEQSGPGDKLLSEVDVVLALATIDPSIGAKNLTEVASTAVAFVTAGRSSELRLRSVAEMSEAAGLRLNSVILIGADARDESVGLLGARATRRAPISSRFGVSP